MCHLDMSIIANLVKKTFNSVKKTFYMPDMSKKIKHLVRKMSGICKKSRTMILVKVHTMYWPCQ